MKIHSVVVEGLCEDTCLSANIPYRKHEANTSSCSRTPCWCFLPATDELTCGCFFWAPFSWQGFSGGAKDPAVGGGEPINEKDCIDVTTTHFMKECSIHNSVHR